MLSNFMLAQSSLILRNIALWWDFFSTCFLLALILLIRSRNCFSSCTSQPLSSGVVKRLLRYLSGTLDHGIVLYRHSPLMLHAFFDFDSACNNDYFTSIGAFIVYLGRNSISWSFEKQCNVARSFTEAEYRSIATIDIEVRWDMLFANRS